ncbi:MAG: hypothetical protein RIQ33_1595, partial [Bacteroidota bacterium]
MLKKLPTKIQHTEHSTLKFKSSKIVLIMMLAFSLSSFFSIRLYSQVVVPTAITNCSFVSTCVIQLPTPLVGNLGQIYTIPIGQTLLSNTAFGNSGSLTNTSTNVTPIFIYGELIIDHSFTFKNVPYIVMGPCAKITVKNMGANFLNTLTLDATHIYGDPQCKIMWQGITLEANTLINCTTTSPLPPSSFPQKTIIEDAQIAISSKNNGGIWFINKQTTFNNNYVDLQVFNYHQILYNTNTPGNKYYNYFLNAFTWWQSGVNSVSQFPSVVTDANFTCKTNGTNATLSFAPYAGKIKKYCIEDINNSQTFWGNPTNIPSLCTYCGVTKFENFNVGIYCNNTFPSIKVCNFINSMGPFGIGTNSPKGIGVYVENCTSTQSAVPNVLVNACTFDKNFRGIYSRNCHQGSVGGVTMSFVTKIDGNQFSNSGYVGAELQGYDNNTTIDIRGNVDTKSPTGVFIHDCYYNTIQAQANTFYDNIRGFWLNKCIRSGIDIGGENYFVSQNSQLAAGLLLNELDLTAASSAFIHNNYFYLTEDDQFGISLTATSIGTNVYNNYLDLNKINASSTLDQTVGIEVQGANGTSIKCNRINDYVGAPIWST